MGILQEKRNNIQKDLSKSKRLMSHLEEKGYSYKDSYEIVYGKEGEKGVAEKRGWVNKVGQETEKGIGYSQSKDNISINNPFRNAYLKKIRKVNRSRSKKKNRA